MRIIGVAETHIHADFLSGTRELAERSGARMYLSDAGPPEWRYGYRATTRVSCRSRAGNGSRSGTSARAVADTPGHTPEHLSFFVTDGAASAEPMGLLTGDFVFVGDVGRPDLLEKAVRVVGSSRRCRTFTLHQPPAIQVAARSPPGLAGAWRGLGLREGNRRGAAVHRGLREAGELGARHRG